MLRPQALSGGWGILSQDPFKGLKLAGAILRKSVPLDRLIFPSGYSFPPVAVIVELSRRCNLRCACGAAFGNVPGEGLGLRRWGELLRELRRYRPTITITGGEPLLDSRTCLFLKTASDLGFRTFLTTNGTLLDRFAANLILSGLETLRVSIDGSEELHDRLRGVPGTFRRATSGIERLQKEKRKLGKATPRVNIEVTLSGHIQGHLEEMVDLARRLQADRLVFHHQPRGPSAPETRARLDRPCAGSVLPLGDSPWIDVKTLQAELLLARRLSREIPFAVVPNLTGEEMTTYYNSPGRTVRKKSCMGAWMAARILPDGVVATCTGEVMGSVIKTNFFSVWNGAPFCKFRSHLREKKVLPECLECLGILQY